MNDPMLDYTVNKLKNGISALRHLDKFSTYTHYAPRIAESMAHDIQAYLIYLTQLGLGDKDGQ